MKFKNIKSQLVSIDFWQANIGLLLMGVNILLAVILFLQWNPLSLWKTGYEGADAILKEEKLTATTLASVKFLHPLYEGNTQSLALKPDSKRTTGWELMTENENGDTFTYTADESGVKSFLQSLENVRRYFAIERSKERDRELEIEVGAGVASPLAVADTDDAKADADGADSISLNGLTIVLEYRSGKSDVLHVGKVTKDGETYVRLADEDIFYLVKGDIFTKSGGREVNFFRNRNLLQANVLIKTIQLERKNGQGIVKWESKGGIWEQIYPSPPTATKLTLDQTKVRDLLEQLQSYQVQSFLSELPADATAAADQKNAIRFIVRYTEEGNLVEQRPLSFVIVSRSDGQITVEITGEQGQKDLAVLDATLVNQLLKHETFLTSTPPNPTDTTP